MLRLVVSLVLLSGTAMGQSLVWQDQFNLAGGLDQARALTVSNNTVVAAGPAVNASGGIDMLVRAYNGHTGTLTWSDSTPLVAGIITKVLADQTSGIVFAVGYAAATPAASAPGESDFITRAYEASTGNKLWEDVTDAGRDDYPQDLAVSPTSAFVVGYGGNTAGGPLDAITRVYNASTGDVRWTHQVNKGGEDVAWLVSYAGGLVVVASTHAPTILDTWNMQLTAYDELTGAVVWTVEHPDRLPNTMALAGGNVVLSGFNSQGAGFTAAYDLATGASRWENDVRAFEVKAHGDQIVAIGNGIRLYSPTGEIVRTIPADNDSEVHRLAVFGDTLYTVGAVLGPCVEGTCQVLELFTCAFDLNTGANVSDAHRPPEPGWTAFDMVATAGGLFVAGSVNNPQGDSDFLIQAFAPVSIEPQPPVLPPLPPPPPPPVVEPPPVEPPVGPPPVVPPVQPPAGPPNPVPPVVTPATERAVRRTKIRNAKRARVAQVSRQAKRQPFNSLRYMRMRHEN
jgi:putative pyrroloquinoline-quinone binding quinoprotein